MRDPVRLLALLLVTSLVAGCGSSTGPDGDLFLRFRANGALVEFNDQVSLLGSFGEQGAQAFLLITGFDATSNAGIQVYDDQVVTRGTYSGYTVVNNVISGVLLTYQAPGGVLYTQDPQAPVDGTVTITEIGAARAGGTFSGTLSATGQPDLMITDGEFFVLRTN